MNGSSGGSIEGVSHFGIQVADLATSIAFYRDLLGLELIAEWVRDQPYIQELVGYPGVELNVAVFRLPGSASFLEILEYRNVEAPRGRSRHSQSRHGSPVRVRG